MSTQQSSEVAHTTRAHARLAPSAASRWFNCPRSVRATDGIEQKSSVYADEGTAAHTLADKCLRTGSDADRWLDGSVNIKTGEVSPYYRDADRELGHVFEITEEMASGVQEYVDEVRYIVDYDNDEFEIEQRLDITAVHPDLFGTGDLICYKPATRTLVVCDFKYGQGVMVSPVENKQLLTYAVGAALRYHNRGLGEVQLVVVQPRAQGETIKRWSISARELLEWQADLEDAAARTDDPDAPFVAGEWCRFCLIAATCETKRNLVFDLAQAEFSETGEVIPKPPSKLSPEELAKIVKQAAVLKNWFKSVEKHAHEEAMEGRVPPGLKLVPKRAVRKWKDEDEAISYLTMYGLEDDQLYTRKFASPAQIEKIIGKKKKGDIGALVASVSSGTNLVPIEDERSASVHSAADEFGG